MLRLYVGFTLFLLMVFHNACSTVEPMLFDKPISVSFHEVDVKEVLRYLADFVGINLIIGESVKGNITLQLNNITWDHALDAVLKSKGLEKRLTNRILIIDTSRSFVDTEQQQIKYQASLLDQEPMQIRWFQIKYAKAEDLVALIKSNSGSIVSNQGIVTADPRTNAIFLHDHERNIRQMSQMLEQLDVPVKQVEIEAKIVNMSQDSSEDLGIQWGLLHPEGAEESASRMTSESKHVGHSSVTDRLNVDLAAIPLDASPASLGLALAKLSDHALLDLELSALESEGRAEIIASPRLMTTNQKSAVIESGEDIPYQEATLSGATAVSFKKAVLRLKVTPHITPNGRLLMELHISQDTDSGKRVQGVPILLTKAIETQVLVNHGETIVLGGIYKQNHHDGVTGVPVVGKLPVIGHLFSRSQVRTRHEELLIFITPRIMEYDVKR